MITLPSALKLPLPIISLLRLRLLRALATLFLPVLHCRLPLCTTYVHYQVEGLVEYDYRAPSQPAGGHGCAGGWQASAPLLLRLSYRCIQSSRNVMTFDIRYLYMCEKHLLITLFYALLQLS